jgi:uncharacterized membrane protein YqhA
MIIDQVRPVGAVRLAARGETSARAARMIFRRRALALAVFALAVFALTVFALAPFAARVRLR